MQKNTKYNYNLFGFHETEKITMKEVEAPKWKHKWTCPDCGCHMVAHMATSLGMWGYDIVCVCCNMVLETINEEIVFEGTKWEEAQLI